MHGLRTRATVFAMILTCFISLRVEGTEEELKRVVVEGVAVIYRDDVAIARDQAVDDALRRAVSQAVGTFIEAESIVRNLQLINQEIYQKTRGYVRQYTPVKELRQDNMLRVTVLATVDTTILQGKLRDIGLLYQRMRKPRFMVIISEADAGRRPSNPAGETEIIRQLLQKDIKVVDQAQVQRIRDSDQIRKILAGDTKAAKLIALRHGAEILVVGQAFGETARQGQLLGGLVSVRARLQARAIHADTGEILVADGQFASGVDIEEQVAVKKALVEVGNRWVQKNLPEILRQWEKDAAETSSVQLVVNGLNLRQLIQFESALRDQIRGIRGMQRRSLDNNVAILDIDLRGVGQDLADIFAQRSLTGFEVEVIRFSPHFLDLKVQQRK